MIVRMNSVQQKISCVFETGVVDEPSNKRSHQQYKVTATQNLLSQALNDGIASASPTEKLDGTCCFVDEFKGKPCIWARHDRKPSKVGKKRFAQFKTMKKKLESEEKASASDFKWDPTKDFNDVPKNWIPAKSLHVKKDGIIMPDSHGHTPGWVPVMNGSRQHCWHLDAVNLIQGTALVLRQDENMASDLVIECQPLSRLDGQTFELIGTNINGNPYNLGNKKYPFHVLVGHGSLTVTCPKRVDYDSLVSWMSSDHDFNNQVEGVVWHCQNGQMYKLHRHHLNMRWPEKKPSLCQRKVKVQVSVDEACSVQDSSKAYNLSTALSSLNGDEFDSLLELCQVLIKLA